MSNTYDTPSASPGTDRPLTVLPARRSPGRVLLTALLAVLILCGLPLGALWLLLGALFRPADASAASLTERHHAGPRTAIEKIAVVRVDGVLMEGFLGYAQKQIERAAEDPQVKAVVLRVNSPGGTITASDDLHRRLVKLRDGDPLKKTAGKPLVVSMGALAASGGYYIAMPAATVFAERTTITGSIGVFAAFPNVKELAEKIGVQMIVVKRGGVKDSGSPFQEMKPTDRALWQSLIDDAYERFKAVVEEGRPGLKGKMEEKALEKTVTLFTGDESGKDEQVHLVRRRADGGTFTAAEALELGLIDQVGYLEDAVETARRTANLTDQAKVILYDRPPTLLSLLGIQARQAGLPLDAGRAAEGLVPRLWYLTSQAELAGLLRAMGPAE